MLSFVRDAQYRTRDLALSLTRTVYAPHVLMQSIREVKLIGTTVRESSQFCAIGFEELTAHTMLSSHAQVVKTEALLPTNLNTSTG